MTGPLCPAEDCGPDCPECLGEGELTREQGFARLAIRIAALHYGGDPSTIRIAERTEDGGAYIWELYR